MSKNRSLKKQNENKWLETLKNKKYDICLSDQLGMAIPVKKEKHYILDHAGAVVSIAVSPDARFLFTNNKDGRVNQWSLDTGSCVMVYEGNKAVLSTDGLYLYTVCKDKTICQWDTKSGRCEKRFEDHTNAITEMVLDRDNKYIFSGTGLSLRIWNTKSGNCIRKIEGLTIPANLLTISPGASFFYTILNNDIICQYDTQTAKCINSFETHSGRINSMVISPDGTTVFTGGDDKSACQWDLKSGRRLNCFKGHTNTVEVVRLTPDGEYLFSLGLDWSIRQWHIKSGRCVREFQNLESPVKSAVIDLPGNYLFTGHHNKSVHQWDLKNGKTVKIFGDQINDMRCAGISHRGRFCFVANVDGTVSQWDLQTGRCTNVFKTGHIRAISSIILSSDGQYLFISGSDTTVRQFSTASGELLMIFRGHTNSVESIVISPCGEFLYSGGLDKTVRKWHIGSGKQIAVFDHADFILSMAISKDGKHLWTGSHYRDGSIRQWETETGRCVNTFEGHGTSVYCMVLDTDDYFLFSASGNTVRQWEIKSGRCNEIFKNNESVYSLAISPCHRYLFSGSHGAARQWDIKSRRCINTFKSHRHDSSYVAVTPNGKLLTGRCRIDTNYINYSHRNNATKIKIWDIQTGEMLVTCYNLKKGFLWLAPPCEQTGLKYFWTDRPELLNVYCSYQDGSEPERLQLNDPKRELYISVHNREDMVMGRLYNPEGVKEEQARSAIRKEILTNKARIKNSHAMIEYKSENL